MFPSASLLLQVSRANREPRQGDARSYCSNQITLARVPILTAALLPCHHGLPQSWNLGPCLVPALEPKSSSQQPAQGHTSLLRLEPPLILLPLSEVPKVFCLNLQAPPAPQVELHHSIFYAPLGASSILAVLLGNDHLLQCLRYALLYLP